MILILGLWDLLLYAMRFKKKCCRWKSYCVGTGHGMFGEEIVKAIVDYGFFGIWNGSFAFLVEQDMSKTYEFLILQPPSCKLRHNFNNHK